MNAAAAAAIAWTRTRLDAAHRAFLAQLPLTVDDGDRLYVHASASAPDTWIYVMSAREAFQSFRATPPSPDLLRPHAFSGAVQRKRPHACRNITFRPTAVPSPCSVSVAGSPCSAPWASRATRIRLPATVCSTPSSNRLTYVRVPYDVELAARKIRKAGLPEFLAARLTMGI